MSKADKNEETHEEPAAEIEQSPEVDKKAAKAVSEQSRDAQVKSAAAILATVNGGSSLDDDDGQADDDYDYDSPPVVAGTPKKRGRKPKNQAPATASVPAKVKNMMGDGTRFRFYKVDQIGNLSLCGDYSDQSLALTGNDIELFVQQYLVHEYGPGGYVVKAFNDKGSLLKESSYSVLKPSGDKSSVATTAAGGAIFERSLVTQANEELQELRKKISEQERIDREKAEKRQEKMEEELLALKSGGGDSTMTMVMMMLAQSRADAAAAREDQRREEMRREERELKQAIAATSAPAPMLPPPPPPPPPQKDLVEQLAALAPVLAMIKEFFPKPDTASKDAKELFYESRIRDLEKLASAPKTIDDIFNEADKIDEMMQRRGYAPQKENGLNEFFKSFAENFQGNLAAIKDVITAAPAGQPQLTQGQPQPQPQPSGALPPEFIEAITDLEDMETDDERVNKVMELIMMFGDSGVAKWENIAKSLLAQIMKGKKSGTMYLIKAIVDEAVNMEMISEETAQKTFDAFETNFEGITTALIEHNRSVASAADSSAAPVPPAAPEPSEVAPVDSN